MLVKILKYIELYWNIRIWTSLAEKAGLMAYDTDSDNDQSTVEQYCGYLLCIKLVFHLVLKKILQAS